MTADVAPGEQDVVHCPACGMPMTIRQDEWVCPSPKCGIHLAHHVQAPEPTLTSES